MREAIREWRQLSQLHQSGWLFPASSTTEALPSPPACHRPGHRIRSERRADGAYAADLALEPANGVHYANRICGLICHPGASAETLTRCPSARNNPGRRLPQ
jgi:hypothetical protein